MACRHMNVLDAQGKVSGKNTQVPSPIDDSWCDHREPFNGITSGLTKTDTEHNTNKH